MLLLLRQTKGCGGHTCSRDVGRPLTAVKSTVQSTVTWLAAVGRGADHVGFITCTLKTATIVYFPKIKHYSQIGFFFCPSPNKTQGRYLSGKILQVYFIYSKRFFRTNLHFFFFYSIKYLIKHYCDITFVSIYNNNRRNSEENLRISTPKSFHSPPPKNSRSVLDRHHQIENINISMIYEERFTRTIFR